MHPKYSDFKIYFNIIKFQILNNKVVYKIYLKTFINYF